MPLSMQIWLTSGYEIVALSGASALIVEQLARKCVLVGLLARFFLDSCGSWAYGNSSNVLFNLLVLLLAAGPRWWPAKSA